MPSMTKVVQSSEYSGNAIAVGCSVNQDGEPLIEVNGKAIGTVDHLLDLISKHGSHAVPATRLEEIERKIDEINSSFGKRVLRTVEESNRRNVRVA